MSKVYNVAVPVVALVRAESPEDAISRYRAYLEDKGELTLPETVSLGAFESESVPEEHVLHLPGVKS